MIDVLHLFPKLNSSLIDVLDGLSSQQWNNASICKKWTVKDIAAHLLDGTLRRLSIGRDGYPNAAPDINSYRDLLDYLNSLNADWVKAFKRVSPKILIEQLGAAQDQLYNYLLTLDPAAPALFPVLWAGEDRSSNWFDIARAYTECWLHQQQIRQAVGAEPLLGKELYLPFLRISMQALAHHYQRIMAPSGTTVRVEIVGDAGGSWCIVHKDQAWEFGGLEKEADAQVYIDQHIAWMLFSKGMDFNEARQYWQVIGDYELGSHALKMVTVIA